MIYYTIDVNKDRKAINGWVDRTEKISGSADMIMERDVAVSLAVRYHWVHKEDGVRVLKHDEVVIEEW